MNPLIIINNHNSLTLVKICSDIADKGHDIEPIIACDSATAEKCREALGNRRGKVLVWGTATADKVEARSIHFPVSLRQRAISTARRLSRIRFGQFLAGMLINTSAAQFTREINIRRKLKTQQRYAAAFFDKWRPSAVLSISDRSHDYMEACLLVEARRRGIKIILPYVAHYDVESALLYRQDPEGRMPPEFNPFARPTFYKLWSSRRLRKTLYKGFFFQHAFLLNAHRKHGSMSAYPWWVGNGISDLICVNSQNSAKVYRAHGVPQCKLRLVGDIFYDTLFDAFTRRAEVKLALYEEYRFDPQRKLVVLAMPQYAEQGYFQSERHWQEIEQLVGTICRTGDNLLISLHPRMKPAEYRYLSEKFRCKIAQQRLAAILPAADAFVSHFSSTVVWAVLCAVPTIVINALATSLPLFDYLKTVKVIEAEGFLSALQDAIEGRNTDFTQDWAELSRNDVFDGRTAERYYQLLRSVSSNESDSK